MRVPSFQSMHDAWCGLKSEAPPSVLDIIGLSHRGRQASKQAVVLSPQVSEATGLPRVLPRPEDTPQPPPPVQPDTNAQQQQQAVQQFAQPGGAPAPQPDPNAQQDPSNPTAAPAAGPDASNPSVNPINAYGPISVSGNVNGNAGLGVPNSPTPTKYAALAALRRAVA